MAGRRIRSRGVRARPALIAATTAAVFGLQMLNFPVSGATSGHLLGGALAAAALGPWWGMISVTLVLVIQAVAFADGGITALGTKVVLMAVTGVLVGGGGVGRVHRAVRHRWHHRRAARIPGRRHAGVHALIGVGEVILTGAVIALVAVVAPGALALDGRPEPAAQTRAAGVLGVVAVGAAGALSAVASALPDGLVATALNLGFADAAGEHWLAGLPLADYGDAAGLFVGVAGLAGVALCVVAALGVVKALTSAGEPAATATA